MAAGYEADLLGITCRIRIGRPHHYRVTVWTGTPAPWRPAPRRTCSSCRCTSRAATGPSFSLLLSPRGADDRSFLLSGCAVITSSLRDTHTHVTRRVIATAGSSASPRPTTTRARGALARARHTRHTRVIRRHRVVRWLARAAAAPSVRARRGRGSRAAATVAPRRRVCMYVRGGIWTGGRGEGLAMTWRIRIGRLHHDRVTARTGCRGGRACQRTRSGCRLHGSELLWWLGV